MTPQEAHHVTLCPQCKIVLNAMIQSRQNELQSKAIKEDRWNKREADRQAEKAFLEGNINQIYIYIYIYTYTCISEQTWPP